MDFKFKILTITSTLAFAAPANPNKSISYNIPKLKIKYHLPMRLELAIPYLRDPSRLEFFPNQSQKGLYLDKSGHIFAFELSQSRNLTKELASIEVFSQDQEQGLVGLTFHPEFKRNKKFYIAFTRLRPEDRTPLDKSPTRTIIEEWELNRSDGPLKDMSVKRTREIIRIDQPDRWHNGGNMVFGPESYLYIGMGDGGGIGDPHKNSQNPQSLLGKILRIDVNISEHHNTKSNTPYKIPSDNPFIKYKIFKPEIWAYGLRNPWALTFDEKKRLIVGDVGQHRLEEINIVESGKNYGWPIKDGTRCYPYGEVCNKGSVDPILEYGRDDGFCVIGGHVYRGKDIPLLNGYYLFADFVTGKLWGSNLDHPSEGAIEIGVTGTAISQILQDGDGEIYVLERSSNRLRKLRPVH